MTYIPIISSSRINRGFGYVTGGYSNTRLAITEKYDDVNNVWSTKANLNTARRALAGFSLNDYGYAVNGTTIDLYSKITEKYDGVTDIWTTKANENTGAYYLSGFALNGFGYTTGGASGIYSNVTEKYDDIANTWTTKANLNTARDLLTGFTLAGYGYTTGGYTGANSTVTEKYDDIANTWTSRYNLNTARNGLTAFTLNGYGYSANSYLTSAATERYDDITNVWTAKADANLLRGYLAGFSLAGYGYTAGGLAAVASASTEKYDDIANTWTTKTNLNTARQDVAGFSLGVIKQGIQNPDIQEIIKKTNKEIVPVDVTSTRATDGTVYTNYETSNLFITVSASCSSSNFSDDAYIQAFSDTNANPSTVVSGKIGFEGGVPLATSSKASIELSFIVRPQNKYKIVKTISGGGGVSLGKWFETTIK